MGRDSRSRSRERRRDRSGSPPRERRREERQEQRRGDRREEERRERRRSRSREKWRDDGRTGSPPRRRSPPRNRVRDNHGPPAKRSRSRSTERPSQRAERQPLPPQEASYRDDGGPGAAQGHGGRAPRLCFKCNQPGHIARECPAAGAGGDDERGMRWGKGEEEPEQLPDKEVEPEFGLSGALAAETNKHESGVVLVHQEPPEARKPTQRFRLYVFKNGEPFGDPLYIHRQSCYLLGRERRVADIPTDHPSCSKQHAVLQYRLTEKEGADGMMKAAVRPYVMDLGSTNGTYLNGERLEAERYYELLEKDLLRFGNSSREYVLLVEK